MISNRKERFALCLGILGLMSFGQANGDEALEDLIEKTYPIEPTAGISIRNDDGSIQIYGAEIREIKMQAFLGGLSDLQRSRFLCYP